MLLTICRDRRCSTAGRRGDWRPHGAIEERYEERRYDIEHPVLEPAEIFQRRRICCSVLEARRVLVDDATGIDDAARSRRPALVRANAEDQQRHPETIRTFAQALRDNRSRVLLAAESPGRRELLLDLLRPQGLAPPVVTGRTIS